MSEQPPSDMPGLSQLPGPDPLAMEVARRRVRARLLGEAPALKRVERFVLERELGSGGMGTVWTALDERLDRTVALKFMRADRSDARDEERMLGEARSLAKLSHPNVIPVYDVGRSEGRVWIAMEFVPGRTLRQWNSEDEPDHRALLAAWIDAGRGLAAVHAAGLIHRDFKPDNVMMGDDGRVRLIDFGLVRGVARGFAASESLDTLRSGARPSSTREGRTGTGFAGTPAYAAPEQLAGETIDARADQYAYCVSVWEALCGARPRQTSPEQARRIPRRIRRALERGLATNPDARFADMAALLDTLTPRRWWIASAVTAALVVGVGGGLAFAPDPEPVDLCAAAAESIDGRWPGSVRLAEVSLDGPTREWLSATLDDWAATWRDAAQRSCEEVHVEHLRSPEVLDRRRGCLEFQLAPFDALLAAAEAGASAAELGERLAALGDPNTCLSEAVAASEPLTVPEGQASAIASLRSELGELALGRGMDSIRVRIGRAEVVHAQAVELDWAPALAEAELTLGLLHRRGGRVDAAREHYGRALDTALESGALELAVRSWQGLDFVALELELDEVHSRWAWERQARLVERLGASPRLRAQLDMQLAMREQMRGRYPAAEAALHQAIASFEQVGPRADWERARAHWILANVLSAQGRAEASQAAFAEARALEREGASTEPNANQVTRGDAELSKGIAALGRGALDEAELALMAAIDEYERALGRRSLNVADVHVALASILDMGGRLDEARAHALRAEAIYVEVGALDHPARTHVLTALGTIAFRERDFEAAVEFYTRALAIDERSAPANSPDVGLHASNLGEALYELGELKAARQELERALAILTVALPAQSIELAYPLKGLGAVALAEARTNEAIVQLERAAALFDALAQHSLEGAETRWLLAQARAQGGDEAGARADAEQAASAFAALGPEGEARSREIRNWIPN